MMSARISDFLTPSPLSAFGSDVYYVEFTQPPLLRQFFYDPLPPQMWMSFTVAP